MFGIVVASVTAPAYEKLAIGSAAFWFGFVTLILLLILVTYRYVTVKEVPDPAKPLICIYAAPTSLCIAGYVQYLMQMYGFLMGMFVVATVIYIFALVKAIGYLKMPFFPSYAAFTLPICHQCDRFKTDDGMCNEYGTSNAVPEICGIDRDDYCILWLCILISDLWHLSLVERNK